MEAVQEDGSGGATEEEEEEVLRWGAGGRARRTLTLEAEVTAGAVWVDAKEDAERQQ